MDTSVAVLPTIAPHIDAIQGLGAERHPGNQHEGEGHQACTCDFHRTALAIGEKRFECVIAAQIDAVQRAPYDKAPTGTVPQAAEQHGNEQIGETAR